ncbi:hypothetical protein MRB53_011656 [Persea americana]|uniref:Uncharacterized protein n=1 Tax=Persea americana TaxID=3435 RepID=A0ACC2LVC1_PERAE|nr:hypothetical protein MRB53_011656 [Persea americana]
MLLHLPLQFEILLVVRASFTACEGFGNSEGLGKDIKSIYMEELGEVVPFFYILPTITKIFICESSVSVERDETTTGIHQQVNFIKPENIGKLGNGELDQHRLGINLVLHLTSKQQTLQSSLFTCLLHCDEEPNLW